MNLRILAAAAATVLSVGASAQTVTFATLGAMDNTATPIGAFKAPGFYLDLYEFTVNGLGLVAGAAISAPIDLPGFPGVEYSFEIASVALLNSSLGVIDADVNGTDGFSLQAPLAAPGTYYFGVLGSATGVLGGAYGGVLQTVVAAVPEPETYAMLLAGLGAMGLISRRRRQH